MSAIVLGGQNSVRENGLYSVEKKSDFTLDDFYGVRPRTSYSGQTLQNTEQISIFSQLEGFEAANLLKASPRCVGENLRQIRRFLQSTNCHSVANITLASIEEWLDMLRKQGYSAKSIINAKSSLSAFCRFLRKRGHLEHNPCLDVELSKPQQVAPAVFDLYGLDGLLALARELGVYCEIAVAAYTGIRRSELARLAWAQVDFNNRVLVVTKTKNKHVRGIPLLSIPLDALRAQYAITGRTGWVFPAREFFTGGWQWSDHPVTPKGMSVRIRHLVEAIPNFHSLPKGCVGNGLHLLRHTYASLMIGGNANEAKVAQWMGHSDSRTLRRYTHLARRYDPEAEKMLGKEKP